MKCGDRGPVITYCTLNGLHLHRLRVCNRALDYDYQKMNGKNDGQTPKNYFGAYLRSKDCDEKAPSWG